MTLYIRNNFYKGHNIVDVDKQPNRGARYIHKRHDWWYIKKMSFPPPPIDSHVTWTAFGGLRFLPLPLRVLPAFTGCPRFQERNGCPSGRPPMAEPLIERLLSGWSSPSLTTSFGGQQLKNFSKFIEDLDFDVRDCSSLAKLPPLLQEVFGGRPLR